MTETRRFAAVTGTVPPVTAEPLSKIWEPPLWRRRMPKSVWA